MKVRLTLHGLDVHVVMGTMLPPGELWTEITRLKGRPDAAPVAVRVTGIPTNWVDGPDTLTVGAG